MNVGSSPPLITPEVARRILRGERRVSLDLGISEGLIEERGDGVLLPDGSLVSFEELERVAGREEAVYLPMGGRLHMVAISDGHFYKLVPTGDAPTLEIDGIRMHRTKGTTPRLDAVGKVEHLEIEGGNVLDTCTGLGYTAIASAERGADLVISIELRYQVLRMAGINPWSRRLFEDPRIHLLLGDSYTLIEVLPENFFHYIIHDPPRISHAGELYSLDFYRGLYRALKNGGRLFHYTGEPGKRFRRLDIRRGVMKRLSLAGFKNIIYLEEIMGVICQKFT